MQNQFARPNIKINDLYLPTLFAILRLFNRLAYLQIVLKPIHALHE